MSGGFKWLELGAHQVVADEQGRILAYIVIGVPTQPLAPVPAFIGDKKIGIYLNDKFARAAVEDAMSAVRRTAHLDSGKAE